MDEAQLYNLYNQRCSCKKDPIFEYKFITRYNRINHIYPYFKYLDINTRSLCTKAHLELSAEELKDEKYCSLCQAIKEKIEAEK